MLGNEKIREFSKSGNEGLMRHSRDLYQPTRAAGVVPTNHLLRKERGYSNKFDGWLDSRLYNQSGARIELRSSKNDTVCKSSSNNITLTSTDNTI